MYPVFRLGIMGIFILLLDAYNTVFWRQLECYYTGVGMGLGGLSCLVRIIRLSAITRWFGWWMFTIGAKEDYHSLPWYLVVAVLSGLSECWAMLKVNRVSIWRNLLEFIYPFCFTYSITIGQQCLCLFICAITWLFKYIVLILLFLDSYILIFFEFLLYAIHIIILLLFCISFQPNFLKG